MRLFQITDNCWYSESDQTYDRPSLGYIRGSSMSVAVDTGNSPKHWHEFMQALELNGLERPSLCVLTHWHWDHVLGISAAGVPVAACRMTQLHLQEMCGWSDEEKKAFYDSNIYAQAEYTSWKEIRPATADIVYDTTLTLDIGGVDVCLEHVQGPHSDDSVLVSVPTDGMLFAGDSSAGDFSTPNIAYDPVLLRMYTEKIGSMYFRYFLHSHRQPLNRDETMRFLEEAAERGYYTF